MRQIELIANEEGEWAFHCHKSHHTMNAPQAVRPHDAKDEIEVSVRKPTGHAGH